MQRSAGLRGASANAHRDDKMSGTERHPSQGWMRQLKKTANRKRRQRSKQVVRAEDRE